MTASGKRAERVILALAVAASAVAIAVLVGHAPPERLPRDLLMIWIPVLTGLFAMHSPYSARFGRALVGCGLIWSLTVLGESGNSVLYSIGRVSGWLVFPLLFYLVLSFPNGRLGTAVDRALYWALMAVLAIYVGSALFIETYPPGTPWTSCVTDCPPNAFLVLDHEPAVMSDVVQPLRELLTIALMLGVIASLAQRLRRASRFGRPEIAPVLVAAVGSCASLVAFLVVRRVAPGAAALDTLAVVWSLCIPGLGAAFFIGLMRRRLQVARALERLSMRLAQSHDTERLRVALADVLDDPRVQLLAPGEALPPAEAGRSVTAVTDGPHTVALLVHGEGVDDDPEFRDALCALVLSALRQRRTQARLEHSLGELADSRNRVMRAALRERARIERDLHDGAQQRLIALRIRLSLADELLRSDPEAGRAAVAELGGDVDRTLAELRELAHGVYPALLSNGGLSDALRAVAVEAPLPIHLALDGVGRQPPELEAAVYFTCLEALQNAVKHASGASAVWITLRQADALSFEVRDDGPGFTPAHSNGGLRNMSDRVEAVGGELTIFSAPGEGARVRGYIPLVARSR